jgi:hypothetical protein
MNIVSVIAVLAFLFFLLLPALEMRKRRRREAVMAEKLQQYLIKVNEETGVRESDPR